MFKIFGSNARCCTVFLNIALISDTADVSRDKFLSSEDGVRQTLVGTDEKPPKT